MLYYEANGNFQEAKTQRTASTYIKIEGLKVYTNYCISVAAMNEHGVGKYSYPECLYTDEGGEQQGTRTGQFSFLRPLQDGGVKAFYIKREHSNLIP